VNPILALLFVVALFAATHNYAEWATRNIGNSYFYNRQRNGWWFLFWIAVMVGCVWFLEIHP
jgi:hypothetical protein